MVLQFNDKIQFPAKLYIQKMPVKAKNIIFNVYFPKQAKCRLYIR